MVRVVVPYSHDPADLAPIHLGVSPKGPPTEWTPALRDTIDQRLVVWARFPQTGTTQSVWVRDHTGDRRMGTQVV